MAIDRLDISRWVRNTRQDRTVDSPSWEEVEAAIRALNNVDLNDLYLHPHAGDPETYLSVGGGGGQYFVTGAIRNESFPILEEGEGPDDEVVDLTVGGQTIDLPRSSVVTLDVALRAAKAFWEAGGFDCGIDWHYG